MLPENPGFCSPSHSPPPSHGVSLSILDGASKKRSSLAGSLTAGENERSLKPSHLPQWRNHELRGPLLALSCAAFEQVVTWLKRQCPCYPPPCSQSCIFFFLRQCATSSPLDSQTSTKATLSVGDFQNWCPLGENSRKLLFCYFAHRLLF